MNRQNELSNVKCNKCGWIHFEVDVPYVKKWLEDWISYWPTLTDESKNNYGLPDGPPGIEEYLRCSRCGNTYKDFVDPTSEDLRRVYGSTIGPILRRTESFD